MFKSFEKKQPALLDSHSSNIRAMFADAKANRETARLGGSQIQHWPDRECVADRRRFQVWYGKSMILRVYFVCIRRQTGDCKNAAESFMMLRSDRLYFDKLKRGNRSAVSDFVWPVRVYFEDTDSGGVVYYANYLKYMERARTEWLRSLGFEQDALAHEHSVLFVVRSVALQYRRPARFNDLLTVKSRVVEARGAEMVFEQAVARESQADETLCAGRIEIACVDPHSFRPKRIPRMILTEVAGGA